MRLHIPYDRQETAQLEALARQCTSLHAFQRPCMAEVRQSTFATNPFMPRELPSDPLFCIGAYRSPVYVIDRVLPSPLQPRGYGRYGDGAVRCSVDSAHFGDSQSGRHSFKGKQAKLFADALETFRRAPEVVNNPVMMLRSVQVSRLHADGGQHVQQLALTFQATDYVFHRATRAVWDSHTTLQEKLALIDGRWCDYPQYSTSFGVHVALITTDGYLVFGRRPSTGLAQSPGQWQCGAIATMMVTDDANPYVTASRAVRQQFDIDVDVADVSLFMIYLKVDTHEPGMAGFVDLRGSALAVSWKDLQMKFSTASISDKRKNCELKAVKLAAPESCVRFIKREWNSMVSSARVVSVTLLQHFFGVAKIAAKFS